MYAQLDGLGGKLAVVAKSPIEQVATFARYLPYSPAAGTIRRAALAKSEGG